MMSTMELCIEDNSTNLIVIIRNPEERLHEPPTVVIAAEAANPKYNGIWGFPIWVVVIGDDDARPMEHISTIERTEQWAAFFDKTKIFMWLPRSG
jgi:hypothetical protein